MFYIIEFYAQIAKEYVNLFPVLHIVVLQSLFIIGKQLDISYMIIQDVKNRTPSFSSPY